MTFIQFLTKPMKHILHDAHVAWWAWRTDHPERRDFRIAFTGPASIRRVPHTNSRSWFIHFQRPGVHLLNAYRVELDYLRENPSARSFY